MKIIVTSPEEGTGAVAAERILEQLDRRASPVLGLATGSSPLGIYRDLARRAGEGTRFGGLAGFALDEYVGLGAQDPNSYAAFLQANVVKPLGLEGRMVRVPNGTAASLDEACDEYERAIDAAGGVDVQILGIGSNGHIGFNEPGSTFDSKTRVVQLTEQTRTDNARFFQGLDDVPAQSITQGIATIMRSRSIVLVAQGDPKARAVHAMVHGPVTAEVPASVLQHHDDVTVVLDPRAAALLG